MFKHFFVNGASVNNASLSKDSQLYCTFVMLSVIVIALQVFNEMFKELMPEPEVLAMLSHSQEFEQVKVYQDSSGAKTSLIIFFAPF